MNGLFFLCVLNGSYTVRWYKLTCTFAKEVQFFPGLGMYSGTIVIYLHYALTRGKESRTTTFVFALCILYILSTATVFSDLIAYIIEVSNNSICKYIIFYQLCSGVSVHYHFSFKLTHSQWYIALKLSKSQHSVVTSSPNVHWYA